MPDEVETGRISLFTDDIVQQLWVIFHRRVHTGQRSYAGVVKKHQLVGIIVPVVDVAVHEIVIRIGQFIRCKQVQAVSSHRHSSEYAVGIERQRPGQIYTQVDLIHGRVDEYDGQNAGRARLVRLKEQRFVGRATSVRQVRARL